MKKFWIQMITFLTFSLVAPCVYLVVRFNLFKTTSKLQVGLWGIVVFAILIGVLCVLIKYYIDGLKTRYSWFKQVLQGFIKLILPLILLLIIMLWLDDNIYLVKESLFVIIPCEFVAILINPLPKWCFENNVEGIGEITDKILNKHNESE